jgi:folate-dependent phosphoribosylglycinamide formyltransferase PurN
MRGDVFGVQELARNQDYQLLLLTSVPGIIEGITALAREHFANVDSIYWQMGNMETKADVMRRIEASGHNLIISHVSSIILKPHHLAQATFGAVNIHPAPPEHPGAWGIYCQPVIRRDVRSHHGVTLHEINETIDSGPIYAVERWRVGEHDSIKSVMKKSMQRSEAMLTFAVKTLAASANGSKCFTQLDEDWDGSNGHHGIVDVRTWFDDLDPAHPAHQERVVLNHPKAIMAPPYFSDPGRVEGKDCRP